MLKAILDQGFECYKRLLNLRLLPQRIKSGVTGKVIDKYQIILEVIDRENWRCPNISIDIIKRMV